MSLENRSRVAASALQSPLSCASDRAMMCLLSVSRVDPNPSHV